MPINKMSHYFLLGADFMLTSDEKVAKRTGDVM